MQNRPATELGPVRRWQRSAAVEGRGLSLTKCGVTESMTVLSEVRRPSRVLADFQQIESCLIRFLFVINSSKKLVFEVRLRIVRHHISRHCIVRLLRIIRLFVRLLITLRFLQVIIGD